MEDDFYQLLEIDRSANDEEIKRSYRRLARELHPDTNSDPAAEERFKKITVAYETLRDPERQSGWNPCRRSACSNRCVPSKYPSPCSSVGKCEGTQSRITPIPA